MRTCFAATRVRDLAADPAFAEARRAVSVRDWTYEDQAEAGPESVAFLTSIEARRLPPDWRVGLAYVSAEYSLASGSPPIYSLRPTVYETEGSSLSHAWVLPESAVRRLSSEPQVELELRYYLALLEPHEFRLPTDGRRHAVPKLGYCSAKLDSAGNSIEVNCFSGLDQPAQVSAELRGHPRQSRLLPAGLFAALGTLAVRPERQAQHRLASAGEGRSRHRHRVDARGLRR